MIREAPVSSFQEGLFFLFKLDPQSTGAHCYALNEIKADLNLKVLEECLKHVIKRHEIFRTHFKEVEEGIVQVIKSENEVEVSVERTDIISDLWKEAREIASRPFDLEKGPLYRFHLFKLEKNRFAFLWIIHHIITDRSTDRQFFEEVSLCYEEILKGKSLELPKPKFQYADYVIWEKNTITPEVIKLRGEYWKKKFQSAPDFIHLPIKGTRPIQVGSRYETLSIEISHNLWQRALVLASEQVVTKSILVMAVTHLFLHRLSGDKEICVGSSIDLRRPRGFLGLMGPLINNYVIYSDYDFKMPFCDYLAQISKTCEEAYSNSDIPFDKIIGLVQPTRSRNHAPLFQVMCDVVEQIEPPENRKLSFIPLGGDPGAQDMDICVRLVERKNSASLLFRYDLDLFDSSQIKEWLESYKTLLEGIVSSPKEAIGNFSLLSENKKNDLLEKFSGVEKDFEKCQGIQEYFEEQVKKTPNAIALEFESKTLTYSELNNRANQLAHYLRKNGVSRNIFVGILMERSFEMFIGILGVLKAGGAYVPMDPEYPKERLDFIITDTEASVVLKQKLPEEILGFPTKNLKVENSPEDAAYMIYTSGSTGKPKGCPNTHKNIANYLQFVKDKHPMGSQDKLLYRTPFTFDVSVPEILYPLMCGARVVIAEPKKHGDTGYLVKLIQERSITETGFVPSTLQVLLEEEGIQNCSSLKIVTAIGEILPVEVVRRFYECLPQAKLINSYGPTEAAVAVTYWECSPQAKDFSSTPIGYPIPNTKIYILDELGQPVPVGVYGELFIGGVQVARGYWKRPDLTSEKFVEDPFSNKKNARMYRTGDRARFLDNGALEYQGRIDFQVKLRGFRIELGEIESVLIEYPGIKQAAVVVKKLHGEESSGSIVAYFVPKTAASLDQSELKEFLKQKLPEYMVPSVFVLLESLPQITSGKVDRKALMARQDEIKSPIDNEYSPPQNDLEKNLASIWEDVLKISPVGRDHNFFSLGGDSLSLIRILSRLRKSHFNLTLEDLYVKQTVADLAKLIQNKSDSSETSDEPTVPTIEPIAITSKEKRFPLTFQQEGLWRGIQAFNFTTVISLINSLSGPLNGALLKECLEEIINRHWVLKTKFISDEDTPFQVITPPESEFFFQKDFRDLPEDKIDETVIREIQEASEHFFDIKKSPLIKCDLLRTDEEEYILVLLAHHLVFDGVSLGILRDELKERYSAKISKVPLKILELPVQFVDYAIWERKYGTGKYIEKKLQYWKKTLDGLPLLKLPTDFSKSQNLEASNAIAGVVQRKITKQFMEKLKIFTKQQSATVYLIFLSAFSTLLHRVCMQDEIVFNTVLSPRPPEVEKFMGYFMTILPIRVNHSGRPTFIEVLTQVKKLSFDAHANQVDTGSLQQGLGSTKDLMALQKIGVMFNFTLGVGEPLDLPGIFAEKIELESDSKSHDDIFFSVSVSKDEAKYSFFYDQDLFTEKRIAKMADQFEAILKEVAEKA